MSQILIVDDDPQLRSSFERLLSAEGHQVQTAVSGESAVRQVGRSVPDLVIMDVRLPGMTGLEAYREMRQLEPKLPVIIMTAYGTTDTAIEATKLGAYDYVLKPFEIPRVLELIDQALQAGRFMRTRVRVGSASGSATEPDALIGRGAAMQEVYKAIGRVAPTDATVLIRGESGTGKELVAQALHRHSARANKPFVAINTAAIPKDLLESELFGHEKGAFTGATTTRHGRFEQAEGGTLFLDEIGDMPLSMQVKLLRVIQERRVTRVGGDKSIPVNLHLLSASHQDLKKLVTQGRFREDLYYRLNVIQIQIPPLRQRREDILWLARRFLAEVAPDKRFGDEAEQALLTHDWPGNVRELRHAVERGSILTPGLKVGILALFDGETDSDSDSNESLPLSDFVAQSERRYILKILDNYAGHLGRTAEALGISRKNLWEKMKKLGLSRNEGDAQ